MSESQQDLEESVDDHFAELLKFAITIAYERSKNDQVAQALLAFLVRIANSWLSIRTLYKHAENRDGFLIDAGMILRGMFDAYLQAEYVIADDGSDKLRAAD